MAMAATSVLNVSAETFTADDFCGDGKFCLQTFWASEMLGTDLIQESSWGTFTKIDDTHIRLSSFKNSQDGVNFTIDGDQLILDNSNGGKDTETAITKVTSQKIKDNEGNYVRLESVTHHMSTHRNHKDYHYFKCANDDKDVFKGTISKNEGVVYVTFSDPSLYIQFRKRSSGASREFKEIWYDWYHTYKKVEFSIQTCSDLNSDYPYAISESYNAAYILNFGGYGMTYKHLNSTSSTLVDKGVAVEIKGWNRNDYTSIPKQEISGNLSPDYSIDEDAGRVGIYSDFNYPCKVNDNVESHIFVESIETDDNSNTIANNFRFINSGWHKNFGGNASIEKDAIMTLSYKITEVDRNGSEIRSNSYFNQPISYTTEISRIIELQNVVFATDEEYKGAGFEFKVAAGDYGYLFDSYDVYAVVGKFNSINDDADNFTEEESYEGGHKKAILLKSGIPASQIDQTHLVIISTDELYENGWSNVKGSDGNWVTLYLKGNYKDNETAQSVNGKYKEATASKHLFSGLTPQVVSIVTGIDGIAAEAVTIEGGYGAINVSGANCAVAVYDASGRTVYSGNDTAITVSPGLYIVKVGNKTRKVMVK